MLFFFRSSSLGNSWLRDFVEASTRQNGLQMRSINSIELDTNTERQSSSQRWKKRQKGKKDKEKVRGETVLQTTKLESCITL